MEEKIFFHEVTKHTNFNHPFSMITVNNFPEQNLEKINKVSTIIYWNQDFVPDNREESHETAQTHRTKTEALCIRADMNVESPITVYITTDYKKIIVDDPQSKYQMYAAISFDDIPVGTRLYPEYPDGEISEAYLMSSDCSYPGYAVIIEYLSDTQYRIVLDSETCYTMPEITIQPIEEVDVAAVRRQLMEGRTAYESES